MVQQCSDDVVILFGMLHCTYKWVE